MTCKECDEIQELAFDKNVPQSTNIAYVRIDVSNVAIVGCKVHLAALIKKLRGGRGF